MPSGKRPQVDAAEQPVEDAAEARVARPLVVGAVADQLLADRARSVARSSPWPSSASSHAAGARDEARVGVLAPGDQPQQRGLAVAVAADDADPVARGDAERDVAQDRAAAVALADAAEVDEVAGAGRSYRAAHPATTLRR